MNNPTTTSLLKAVKYQWKGGLPLPNGYEILDEEDNRLMLYFSEDQAQVHMSLSAIIKYAVDKDVSCFEPEMVTILLEYLEIIEGIFVAPEPASL